jgi:myo-inositol-1(or 4)-monophosphatase
MSEVPGGPYRELLDVALEAARAAVALVSDRSVALEVSSKSSSTDLVTQMDRGAESVIREVIARHRPDDVVMGEEMGDGGTAPGGDSTAPGGGAVTWWVDPIDGTTNYVYDHPGWNVSVAAAIDGRVVAGVVADPTHGRTYTATRGGGAVCDDRPGFLRLGDPPPLDEALIATGFGYDREQRHRQGLVVAELLPRVRDIRRMGAAALDLCSVASGRVDAYYEKGLSPWDVAAGGLSARVGSIDGGPLRPGSVLAAHPALFDPLAELLAELGAV